MQRNGFCMPRYKSSLCCVKWMQRVRAGKYWCPLVKNINPVNCPDPPKKEDVIEHLLAFAKDVGKNLGINEKRQPDKDWALQMLAVLKPQHKFFKKSYVPKRAIDKIMLDNSDGFFDDLPPGKWKKRMGNIYKEPEENKLKRQLALYEKRIR